MPYTTLVLSALSATPMVLQEPAPPKFQDVFILDEATGAPIPGATVFALEEKLVPVWGQLWFTAAAVTGSDGRAIIPLVLESGRNGWLMAQADGYGTTGEMGYNSSEPMEFRLKRETPITVEVVDFLGRPLPLAHLGVAFGCGHTPDLVSAVTGPDGRATLFGVTDYDGGIEDLYVVHPDLSQPSYDSVPYDDVVDGVARYYGEPGFVASGCVLLPSGEPAVGYGVGNSETHRGHWALTNERGEFRLFGCEPNPSEWMVVTPGEERPTFFHGAVPGVYRTLQLDGTSQPESFVDGQEDTWLPTAVARVQISIRGAADVDAKELLRRVPIVVWEEATGMAIWSETDEDGAVELTLPPGRYAVEVGGPESPYPGTMAGRFTVESGGDHPPITLTCELPAPRICSLEVVGLRKGETLFLQTAAGPYLRHDRMEGPKVRLQQFLLPSGPWAAYTYRKGEDGISRRLQVPVPRDIMATLVLRLPE